MSANRLLLMASAIIALLAPAALVVLNISNLDEHGSQESENTDAQPSRPPEKPLADRPDHSHGLRFVESGGFTLTVPPNSWISQAVPGEGRYHTPRPIDGNTVEVAPSERGSPRIFIYVLNRQQHIDDVIIIGNLHSRPGRMADAQWVMNKDGVEFIWRAADTGSWDVTRNGKHLGTTTLGHFRDSIRVKRPVLYTITNNDERTIRYNGQQHMIDHTDFGFTLAAYDFTLLGQPLDSIKATPAAFPTRPSKTGPRALQVGTSNTS